MSQNPAEEAEGDAVSDQALSADNAKRRGQARKFIAELIQSLPQGTHLTAGEVFDRVQLAGLNLSLSTVYRTLGLLKADGVVQSLSGDHGSRYEAHDDDYDHDHLICLSCGYTVEFVDELLKGFGQVLAKRNGYEFKRSRFDLYGLCQDCQSKSDEYKLRQTIGSLQIAGEQLAKLESTVNIAISQFEGRKIEKGCESIDSIMQSLDLLQADLQKCITRFASSQKLES